MNVVLEFGKRNVKWIVGSVAALATAGVAAYAAKKSGKLEFTKAGKAEGQETEVEVQ